jgi:CheY-like chemotaxis protein
MINNILDLARLEAGQRDLHPQLVPLRALIQETVDLLEPQAREKGLSLDVVISPDLPETAVLDREKISRVLINLLSNAVKYTSQGGVTVRAAPWQESISFEVEDTGNGVPAHLVATVFEPFRQIRTGHGESARGTGLGLTISKQLVELMGGDLIFVSREGEGTRVSVTLPQLRGAVEVASVASEPPGPAGETGRGRKVLIVEDDASSRYGLRSLLEAEGYSVVEAASLSEAEDVVRSSAPDAVILDITLPDGDGAEWLRLWTKREGPPSFPVIALTGITADEDTRRIEQSGVSAVLQKPVNVGQLLEALRSGAARRQPEFLRTAES